MQLLLETANEQNKKKREKELKQAKQTSNRGPVQETTVELREVSDLQEAFIKWAKSKNYVAIHQEPSSSGGRADAILSKNGKTVVCELKWLERNTADQRDKIRKALGQLLEYNFWPNQQPSTEQWIVLNCKPDQIVTDYLKKLSEEFSPQLALRIYYKTGRSQFIKL